MTYRAIIIGAGRIGALLDAEPRRVKPASHAAACTAHPEVALVGFVESYEPTREAAARRYPHVPFFADVDSALATVRPDVVIVASQQSQHFSHVEVCLRHGVRAVICEKPLADSVDAVARMAQAAQASGTAVFLNHQRRFFPLFARVRDALQAGRIGRTVRAQVLYSNGLANNGSHAIDALNMLTGDEVIWASAHARPDIAVQVPADASVDAVLGYARGWTATLQAADQAAYAQHELTLWGEAGAVRVCRYGYEMHWFATEKSADFEGLRTLGDAPAEVWRARESMVSGVLAHAVDWLAGRTTHIVCGLPEGLRTMRVVEACLASAQEDGRRQLLAAVPTPNTTPAPVAQETASPLALHGGPKTRTEPWAPIHNLGQEEVDAVTRVLREGPLSGFLASAGEGFLGGKEVQAFEREVEAFFGVAHAVTFNSATTALHGAIAALGIGPGDEVIVPPYTMSASVMAVLANGAVPIFADLDPRTFCLDPSDVARRITHATRAIMAVHLYGGVADMEGLRAVIGGRDIRLIEDAAQAPAARWRGKFAGTLGDIGVFSLNIHKTMQTGEGGLLVTNNSAFADRARLSRNHGEVVVDGRQDDPGPIIGSNYRMTEVVAAIGRVQLQRLVELTRLRLALVTRLTEALTPMDGLQTPYVPHGVDHVFYRYALKVDEARLGVSRDRFADAMTAEGYRLTKGYVKPIYLLPVFQRKQVFNRTSFPFVSPWRTIPPDYSAGLCPVVERLQSHELTLTDVCQHPYSVEDVDGFVRAVKKVLANRHRL